MRHDLPDSPDGRQSSVGEPLYLLISHALIVLFFLLNISAIRRLPSGGGVMLLPRYGWAGFAGVVCLLMLWVLLTRRRLTWPLRAFALAGWIPFALWWVATI